MALNSFLIPTECAVSVVHIRVMCISYMLQCLYTIIRENNYASSLKNQLLLWHCYL